MTGYSKMQQIGKAKRPARKGRTLMATPERSATTALALIPEGGVSLVTREPFLTRWIEDQTDATALADARAALAALRKRAERAPEEREAATRLDLRIVRRLGQLPEAQPVPAGRPAKSLQRVTNTGAGRVALSRARAIASIPDPVFEERLAEPKPTQAKLLATAIIPNPTTDPRREESARVHRHVRGPGPESWPDQFDLGLLDKDGMATIQESLDSWQRWCERWVEALASAPGIRRIK